MAAPQHAPSERSLTSDEEALARALSRVATLLPRLVEADMGRQLEVSASEYFCLMHLAEAPEGRLRMGELATATALSFSAVTRVITKLEGLGLVMRRRSSTDGRAFDAVLTTQGASALSAAEPARRASLIAHVFDHLDGVDLTSATTVLDRIVDAHQDRGTTPRE